MAKIIFGEVSASGKSPVTVPRSVGQLSLHYSIKGINNKKVYLFLQDGALYPFGLGLNYGDFKYDELQLSSKTITPSIEIKVNVQVSNTGNMKAKEVVQMYLKDEIGTVTRPDTVKVGTSPKEGVFRTI
jgi:beta-glucosidase